MKKIFSRLFALLRPRQRPLRRGLNQISKQGVRYSDEKPKKPISNDLVLARHERAFHKEEYEKPITIKIWLEKVDGKGEDAEPLLEIGQSSGILGVFDGMGGGGSSSYTDKDGRIYSGAYYASRFAKKLVLDIWNLLEQKDADRFWNNVERALMDNFQQIGAKFVSSNTTLKGGLIKRFPTTIAAMDWRNLDSSEQKSPQSKGEKPQSRASYQVNFVWAGDSRCYILRPSSGLKQLSKDDTTVKADAFSSIYNDPPLSKSINADEVISLNRGKILIITPSILITCTDGCYNYVETPMHFESLLLETLMVSSDPQEWQAVLLHRISEFTGDDASLVLACIGWHSFNAVRTSFRSRYEILRKSSIDLLETQKQKIEELEAQLKNTISEYDEIKQGLWKHYQETYQAYEEKT